MSDSVGASVNGSRIADEASGMSSMSDSEIPCQPRIEDPSKPSPSSNADSSNADLGRRRGDALAQFERLEHLCVRPELEQLPERVLEALETDGEDAVSGLHFTRKVSQRELARTQLDFDAG